MLRKVALLVVASLATGSLLFSVISHSGMSSPIAENVWKERLVKCQSLLQRDGDIMNTSATRCFRTVLEAAIERDSINEFGQAIKNLDDTDPLLQQVCHAPGHALGKVIIDHYNGDWLKAVLETSVDFCDSGLLHGVYDQWGLTTHTTDEWEQFGLICSTALKEKESNCPDVLGHAAYESVGQDPEAALQICALFSVRVQSSCAFGVIMQQYQPANIELRKLRDLDSAVPRSQWGAIIDYCKSLSVLPDQVQHGCFDGVGWVMGSYISSRVDALQTVSSPSNLLEKTTSDTIFAANLCSGNPISDNHANSCQESLFTNLPFRVYDNIATLTGFCRAVSSSTSAPEGICLYGAREKMMTTEFQKLVEQNHSVQDIIARESHENDELLAEELETLRQNFLAGKQ